MVQKYGIALRVCTMSYFGCPVVTKNWRSCNGTEYHSDIRGDLRADKERSVELAFRKHARLRDITGRPMPGLVMVQKEGSRTEASLQRWVDEAVEFTSSLAAKKAGSRSTTPT